MYLLGPRKSMEILLGETLGILIINSQPFCHHYPQAYRGPGMSQNKGSCRVSGTLGFPGGVATEEAWYPRRRGSWGAMASGPP